MLFPSLTLFTAWRNTEGVLRKDSSNVSVPVSIVAWSRKRFILFHHFELTLQQFPGEAQWLQWTS